MKDKPTILLHDSDSKYTKEFDAVLEDEGIDVKRVGPCKPNLNAFAQRFVQSIKQECLDSFICFGEEHLRHLCTEYVSWYNQCRPHQGIDNRVISAKKPRRWKGKVNAKEVVCAPRLGGLLKHYYRKAG